MQQPETVDPQPETVDPRIYVILARESSLAVIFRRGPSHNVQLILWDRSDDTFVHGQWFHGRIYERRCDLSPSGTHLIYFASNFNSEANRDGYYSWTAVSKPPYLSALLLWPKKSTWGGGGLFESESSILLNHGTTEMDLGQRWKLPTGVSVRGMAPWAGGGEDRPILDERQERDGWSFIYHQEVDQAATEKLSFGFDPPVKLAKAMHKSSSTSETLECTWTGLHEQNGPWWVTEYAITNQNKEIVVALGRRDWADVDSNGDMLFASSGKIFRLAKGQFDVAHAKELVDLRSSKQQRIAIPSDAEKW